ncbi:hypothetical protein [Dechloromonas sp. A34]|uniref:hypothetical protein n=1 Tax=Dechloromonas sp. A34 TaxID=447588 RepID=UPI0022493DAF|nr:hypothetical protein [Dechloromonas sp. A34]
MQASLDKAGVGRVEDTASSTFSNVLVVASIPITFLSNLGLIVIAIWSFFVLPWLPTLGVVAGTFIGFSFIWGMLFTSARRSQSWDKIAAAGISLVIFLRLACAGCVVFLGFNYVRGVVS